ncbi:MAG: YtxH domain-containing protein [Thermodesulfobacteriota bacterium]|nr:MAG: YtxH domain-containing protein [Thermodesulfobacteriota bacterium]
MNNSKGVAMAFLIGGVIGAGLALLFAPSSGYETRRRIKDSVEDAGDWTVDRYQDARYKMAESSGKVKQFIGEKKEDLQSAFEAGKDAFQKGKERLTRES